MWSTALQSLYRVFACKEDFFEVWKWGTLLCLIFFKNPSKTGGGPLVLEGFSPPRLQKGGGEELFSYELFSCTYMMPLHIWLSNVHIWDFLLHIWPSIFFWKNHIPCQELFISANANVYPNIISFYSRSDGFGETSPPRRLPQGQVVLVR